MFISPFDTEIKICMANLMYNAGLSKSDISQYEKMKKDYSKTRFADILSANPYLTYNRQPTFWEKTLSALGFRTGYDKDLEQQANAFREYNAQVAQLSSEDQYNTPAAMASRMRVGGLNPDLSGVSGVAPAGEFAAEQTSPNYSEGAQATFGALASTCMDVLSMSMGFMKDLGSLKILQNQYDSGEISNASSMVDMALKAVRLIGRDHTDPNTGDFYYELPMSNAFFRSKRNRKAFSNAFSNSVFSLQNKVQHSEDKANFSANVTEDAKRRGSSYWPEGDAGDYDDFSAVMSAMISPIIQAEEKAYSKEVQNRDKEADNRSEYLEEIDPVLQAETENTQNQAEKGLNYQEIDANSVLRDIIHNLSENARNGDQMSAVALLLFSVLRSKIGM